MACQDIGPEIWILKGARLWVFQNSWRVDGEIENDLGELL